MKSIKFNILFFILLFPLLAYSQEDTITNLNEYLSIVEANQNVDTLLSVAVNIWTSAPDSALAYALAAKKLSIDQGNKHNEAQALKIIGLSRYMLGEIVGCARSFEDALKIFEEINYKEGIANMCSNLGGIYTQQGYEVRALEISMRARDIAFEISDTLTIVSALNNIGLLYSKKDVTKDLALENYKRALELSESAGIKDGIGSQSLNIGEIYLNQGKTEVALEYFLKSIDAFEDINSINITNALNYLGKVYVIYEDYDRAFQYQQESLEISKRFGAKLNTAEALLALAETYYITGKYNKALDYNEQARVIASETGAIFSEMSAVEALAKIYHSLSDFDKAYSFLTNAWVLKDSIYAEKNQEQINKLRIQYELNDMLQENEFLRRDIELQALKNSQQKIFILALFLGIGLTFFFVIFLFRMNKQKKKKANEILGEQNIMISGQKKEITDSIKYASRIQRAVLTPEDEISKMLPDHFILYRPRDIVSGDFYWITKIKERIMCINADCTGHGVPGAFMSMLGIAFLNEIISRNPDIDANDLLNELRDHIIDSLRQRGKAGGSQDGMDLAAMIIDNKKSLLQFAGANNPLLLYRKGKLIEYKPDKMPIGIHERAGKSFTNHIIKLRKNDVVYTFSDGFPDQFGGPKGKKFMTKNLKHTLEDIHKIPMSDQKLKLEKILDDWMAGVDQIDDILVIGIRF
ncbi:MAG: tetratricopeptide repeat protein [Bacteroidales bacterium]|nr:tetratricopeptide repeat protein [Bacteroidales bacterium]